MLMLINIQGNKTYNPVTDQFLINVTLFLINMVYCWPDCYNRQHGSTFTVIQIYACASL